MSELRQRTPSRRSSKESAPAAPAAAPVAADAAAEPETVTATAESHSHAGSSFIKIAAVSALVFHFSWMALKDVAGAQDPLEFYGAIRKTYPFLANVFENDVICILSQVLTFLISVNSKKFLLTIQSFVSRY